MIDAKPLQRKLELTAATVGVTMTKAQIGMMSSYLLVLERWNRTINLTALPLDDFPQPTLDRLVGEALQGCSLISSTAGRMYDLGSGGGSPAIPIAICRPMLSLVLVESRARKVAFLREAARSAGLSAVRVVSDRIGSLPQLEPAGAASHVSIRAVRLDRDVLTTIDHLLSDSGEVLVIGATDLSPLAARFQIASAKGSSTLLRRRR